MRRLIIGSTLAASLLGLGACATLGEPVTLTMAELDQRCHRRGGELQPTGAQTGQAQADYVCHESVTRRGVSREPARSSLNSAIDRSLARGY